MTRSATMTEENSSQRVARELPQPSIFFTIFIICSKFAIKFLSLLFIQNSLFNEPNSYSVFTAPLTANSIHVIKSNGTEGPTKIASYVLWVWLWLVGSHQLHRQDSLTLQRPGENVVIESAPLHLFSVICQLYVNVQSSKYVHVLN